MVDVVVGVGDFVGEDLVGVVVVVVELVVDDVFGVGVGFGVGWYWIYFGGIYEIDFGGFGFGDLGEGVLFVVLFVLGYGVEVEGVDFQIGVVEWVIFYVGVFVKLSG